MNKLVASMIEQNVARRKTKELVENAYPPGRGIRWKRGRHIQSGEVESHLYGEQIRVVNLRTGKQVDIRYSDIVVYDEWTTGELMYEHEARLPLEW